MKLNIKRIKTKDGKTYNAVAHGADFMTTTGKIIKRFEIKEIKDYEEHELLKEVLDK